TSVALLSRAGEVKSLVSVNQDDSHRPFGGVVPEIASRRHTENLLVLVDQMMKDSEVAWSEVTGIAVTTRPGLIGSLLVGLVSAKTLSLVHGIPFVGVNHIEGHLLAPLLKDASYGPPVGFDFPYLGLAVSGGHTHLFMVEGPTHYRLLGQTMDDAAGEAFDKFAKMAGLGFPGGVRVDQTSKTGSPVKFNFPRGLMGDGSFNFSFSGLKTAAQRQLAGMAPDEIQAALPDLCASFQEAIVDVLVHKLIEAAKVTGAKRWTVTGGVSANSRLREAVQDAAKEAGALLALPPLRYCTDNAAMIALAGLKRLELGETSPQDLAPKAQALATDWVE
ncbi:MAG: tRNA (adenosine(37)-N6)-threonylcarbamoyltransferase complex transferase subunit TsaD, partial [Bdellovibrionales bacterium]